MDVHEVRLTSGARSAQRPCFICGHAMDLASFVRWPGAGRNRYAICTHCGAPNEERDTLFVVLDESRHFEAPPTFSDVYALVGGGWRACCDCGRTEAVESQASGWSWVLDHECAPD